MPSLVASSDVSAITENVIPQLNTILKGTPLPPIRSINDITPSLLLDLYELLFRIKLAYATPRDLSAESQLRNIRVLIGHIAHDILKMDLSFLEPQKICMRDEKALGDFLRIFLGVAKLRKAHLDKGRGHHDHDQLLAAGGLEPEDENSLDGSEHTIKAIAGHAHTTDTYSRRPNDHRMVVRSANPTPQKNVAIVRKTPSKQFSQNGYSPTYYKPREIEFTPANASVPPQVPTAPASDTSSVPSDFIHNVNERVSNIWNKLSSRSNRQSISDKPSSHHPRRPYSTISAGTAPTARELGLGSTQVTPRRKPIPTTPHKPTLAEPTPQMKAWLDTAGAEGSNSSHRPRSTHTTPEKSMPLLSSRTAPASFRNVLRDVAEESPLKQRSATVRPKSSHQRPHRLSHSLRGHPTFPLRRVMSAPPSHLGMDVSKAMFSNEPIRLSGRTDADSNGNSSSSSDDDADGADNGSDAGSPASSIATSALSVSSAEWSDTDSIAELRKKRLEALEEIQRQQEAYEEEIYEAEIAKKQIMYAHGRRRSSIPSIFMHHGTAPRSTVSYETISPNSSASVAAERWKARWRLEAEALAAAAAGSPIVRNRTQRSNSIAKVNPHPVYDSFEYEYDYPDGEVAEDDEDDEMMSRNTEDLEQELRGLDEVGLNESKRQIMLFERLIRRAVDKRPPGH
ncbi:hypothetical protein Dda_2654 [Drechslerella dactyloides]|uniref:DUF5745 domain-containing protein n=1 Tax=Drechslerella dactyloides TaxID=74499 RepID=A0AAD6J274_DREDA|nr:hypothetical protein Dda_2654 [Drechslerella dactyloides]